MTDADIRLAALVEAASQTVQGMGKVASGKPDEAPLTSDAKTFRGLIRMLDGLAREARQRDEQVAVLSRKLHRIAELEVRGAAELIERGDWRRIAAELQAIAQEAIGPAPAGPKTARRRSTDRA